MSIKAKQGTFKVQITVVLGTSADQGGHCVDVLQRGSSPPPRCTGVNRVKIMTNIYDMIGEREIWASLVSKVSPYFENQNAMVAIA